MTLFLDHTLCEHANENPSVCPCDANCRCRTRMCPPKKDRKAILERRVSDEVVAEARMLGADRAVVNLHYVMNENPEGRTCGVMIEDGRFTFSNSDAERMVAGRDKWDAFLDELRRLLPVAVVMCS